MLKPLLQRQVVRTTNFWSILWVNAFPATAHVLVAMDPPHWTVPVVVLVIEIPVELARNLWMEVKKRKQHAPLEQLRLGVQLDDSAFLLCKMSWKIGGQKTYNIKEA